MHLATISGNSRIVKWLLIAGCDRFIKNKKGKTAQDLAIEKGNNYLAEVIEDKFTLSTLFNFRARNRPLHRRGFPFYFFLTIFSISLLTNLVYFFP